MPKKPSKKQPVHKHVDVGAIFKRLFYVLFVGSLVLNGVIVYVLVQISNAQNLQQTADWVVDSVNSLHEDAAIEPQTGKVYIPEFRLRLPAYNSNVSGVKYRINDTESGQESLFITTRLLLKRESMKVKNQQSIEDLFAQVHTMQACSRNILVSYKAIPDSEMASIGSKVLGNGKTVYMYSEPECLYTESLQEYVKQIESY